MLLVGETSNVVNATEMNNVAELHSFTYQNLGLLVECKCRKSDHLNVIDSFLENTTHSIAAISQNARVGVQATSHQNAREKSFIMQ